MTDDVVKVQGRTFDRVPEASRNDEYPLRHAILARRATSRGRVLWSPGPILDQGEDGACVGFAWTQEALTSPVRVDLAAIRLPERWPSEPGRFARRLYFAAQRNDEWVGGEYPGAPDEDRYIGTSVVAGARQMTRRGLLKSYHWAGNVDDIRDGILTFGPAVLGVVWFDGMFEAPGGILRVSGARVGGHCVLLNGYVPDHPELGAAFRLTNSWGASWADGGGAWIGYADLDRLMAEEGEAAVVTSRSYGPRA